MILLYLEGSGSKFHSVNTKTFGFQELRKNMSTPKLGNFPNFLDSRSWEKTHIYIYIYVYICTYVYYMILLYLEGSGSKFHSVNTKTSQFSPFLDSRSWEKTCVYIICIYVHMYICTYVYMYICILHDFAIFGG